MDNVRTRADLINEINSEITIGGKLPCYLNEQEYNRIINQSILFFRDSHKNANQRLLWMIKKELFQTPAFTRSRKLILPDNIISVDGLKEVQSTTQTSLNSGKMVATEMYLSSITGSYDLVMKAALDAYRNVAESQYLSEIQYSFNKNDKSLVVTGRTPIYDVIISTWANIEDNKLFNEHLFIRYCAAQAKQSVARLFSAMEFNLPGNVRISPTKYEQEANDEIKYIEEKVKKLNPPSYMIIG